MFYKAKIVYIKIKKKTFGSLNICFKEVLRKILKAIICSFVRVQGTWIY